MVDSLTALVASGRYDTDKADAYITLYDELLAPFRDIDVRLLELGVKDGASLELWRDYFPRGIIAGLDLETPYLDDPTGRIRLFRARQEDTSALDRARSEVAPHGFDIIIDDCSHIGALTEASFWHLFDHHLKPGGLYAIEDWGTGYWPWWPDGHSYRSPHRAGRASLLKSMPQRSAAYVGRVLLPRRLPSHDHGMVGFVKRLVDECGRADIARDPKGRPSASSGTVSRLLITTGLAVVVKAPIEPVVPGLD